VASFSRFLVKKTIPTRTVPVWAFLQSVAFHQGSGHLVPLYDDSRLKQIIDVNGKAVEMAYDTAGSKQTVKDQLGYETTYFYDDCGNVTREIDAEGKITDRTYDDNNWVKSETVISDRSVFPRIRS
jgi:YD repeat-containing protein